MKNRIKNRVLNAIAFTIFVKEQIDAGEYERMVAES